MQIPRFPECYHALVEDVLSDSDQALLRQLRQHPESGRYFTALFCRYSPLVYSLICHATQSSVQVDYLFAQTWKQIYQDLQDISPEYFGDTGDLTDNLAPDPKAQPSSAASAPLTLQNWIIDIAARRIRESSPPEADQIRYSLTYAPPPLWCYLERSLEQLSPLHRLVVVLHKRFGWPIEEVTTYLTSNGTEVDTAAVITLLGESYDQIDRSLPQDIREIYLFHPLDLRRL